MAVAQDVGEVCDREIYGDGCDTVHVTTDHYCVGYTCEIGYTAWMDWNSEEIILESVLWDLGDGTTSTDHDVVHTYAADDHYIYTLTWTHGAASGVAENVLGVPDNMSRDGGMDDWSVWIWSSCLEFTCEFYYYDYLAWEGRNITSFAWSFGDSATSTLEMPNHTYLTEGGFEFTLNWTASDNASGTATGWLWVPVTPDAWAYGWCRRYTCDFTSYTNPWDLELDSFEWDFGDGTNDTTNQSHVRHRFPIVENQTYNVTFTWSAGDDSGVEYINVSLPEGEAYLDIYEWCYRYTCSFSAWGMEIDAYAWDFGDGNVSDEAFPTWEYERRGVYNVTLEWWGEGETGIVGTTVKVPFSWYELPEEFYGGTIWGRVVDNKTGLGVDGIPLSFSKRFDPDAYCREYPQYCYDDNTTMPGGNHTGNQTGPGHPGNMTSPSMHCTYPCYDEPYQPQRWLTTYGYAETDEDGYYVVTGLDNGNYSVSVHTWETEYRDFFIDDFVAIEGANDTGNNTVNVSAPDIGLKTGPAVTGKVILAETGEPVDDAQVSFWPAWIDYECDVAWDADNPNTTFNESVWGSIVCPWDDPAYWDRQHEGDDNATGNETGSADHGAIGASTEFQCPPGEFCPTSMPETDPCGRDYDDWSGYSWAETKPDGTFRATRLAEACYSVGVWSYGRDVPSYNTHWRRVLAVDEDGIDGLPLMLGSVDRVIGKVFGGNATIPHAWVSASPADDETWDRCYETYACWASDETDALGRFSLYDLPKGNWTIWINPPWDCQWNYATQTCDGGNDWAPIVADFWYDGEGVGDLGNFSFLEAKPLKGRVTDSDAKPVVADLSFWSEENRMGGWAHTDDLGYYSVDRMLPGVYDVWVTESCRTKMDPYGYQYADCDWNQLRHAYVEDVVIDDNMTYDHVFRILGSIKGWTKTSAGAALPNVGVGIWCEDCYAGGWDDSNATGYYSVQNLPAGQYYLYAYADGQKPIHMDNVTIVEGVTKWLNLTFSQGVTLDATIKTSSGAAIQGAELSVWNDYNWGYGVADAMGALQIRGLDGGVYSYYISTPCTFNATKGYCDKPYADQSGTFTLDPANPTKAFVLEAPFAILGRVTVAGAGCPECDVYVWSDGTQLSGTALTNSNGNYTVPGMTVGTYNYEVYKLGVLIASGSKAVSAADPRIDVEVLDQGTAYDVSGKVKGADGQGVSGVLVMAILKEGTTKKVVAKATTGSDGSYTLPKLKPGDYILVAVSGAKKASADIQVTNANLTRDLVLG